MQSTLDLVKTVINIPDSPLQGIRHRLVHSSLGKKEQDSRRAFLNAFSRFKVADYNPYSIW